MIKPYLFSSLLLFIGHISFGQNFGEYYVSISADSLPGRRIKFLSDTTIELSKIPRRESHSFKVIYKYISKDTIIQISPDIVSDDSQSDRFIDKSAVLKSTVILKKNYRRLY